VARYQIVN